MTAVTGLAKQVPRRLAISGHDKRSADEMVKEQMKIHLKVGAAWKKPNCREGFDGYSQGLFHG